MLATADERLVRALGSRRGDRAARALYRAYGPELYGFSYRRLGDRGLAEEVVQDVFTKAWRSADDYDSDRGSVRTWLYGIARNALIDAERRRGRRPAALAYDPPDIVAADEPIEQAMLRWQVELALQRLTDEHREVIRLTQFEGLKLSEVATRTGLPIGTVKSRVHYAVQNFRLALEELEVTR